jgi:hypothetical protein
MVIELTEWKLHASLLDESAAANGLLFDVRPEIKEKQCK